MLRMSSCCVAACVLLVGGAPVWAADEVPKRKSGLWEITTQTRAGGQAMPMPMVMQVCVDQKQDDVTVDQEPGTPKPDCSKMDVKRSGSQVTIDSVCTHEAHSIANHMTVSGNMTTDYRIESMARINPPMQGVSAMDSTVTGKWLGACKPGQKHGARTMAGMPGVGPGGKFKMDPELMKRMQKQMQEQYGQ
ncbi:MAG: DUF3617 family protein [Thiobacillus sp.]